MPQESTLMMLRRDNRYDNCGYSQHHIAIFLYLCTNVFVHQEIQYKIVKMNSDASRINFCASGRRAHTKRVNLFSTLLHSWIVYQHTNYVSWVRREKGISQTSTAPHQTTCDDITIVFSLLLIFLQSVLFMGHKRFFKSHLRKVLRNTVVNFA